MAKTRRPKARSQSEQKVPRTFRLAPGKLEAAQRILGAATATETIESALDMIVFRDELLRGTRDMLGITIAAPDAER